MACDTADSLTPSALAAAGTDPSLAAQDEGVQSCVSVTLMNVRHRRSAHTTAWEV